MNFYKNYAERVKNATPEQKAAALAHWQKCHVENVNSGRTDLIIFSSKILGILEAFAEDPQ